MPNTALSIAYVRRFVTTEILTIGVETAVLFFLMRYVFKKHALTSKQIFFAGIFASFSTIPYVWFIFPNIMSWPRPTSLMYSEPFVTIIEAIFYRFALKTDWKVSIAVSVICNISSYVIDIALRANGIWFYW
ncbi:MAG: hypothetical protein KBD06_05005 [Candidatus Pacebacteria bacterium]|nr:hypothetical protein [Candidatus Paceibacterota bacterium]